MRSLNKVFLMGHLAADPELRQTKSGFSVANFPLATNRSVKTDNGDKSEITDFHRIIVWRGLADVCEQYLAKGSAVYIEGKIVNRSFEDKTGNRHFRTEITADDVNILTWKKTKNGSGQISLNPVKEDEKEEALED